MIVIPRSWEDLARWVAIGHGLVITGEEATYVLWNHTGFPAFWPLPAEERSALLQCVDQLDQYFSHDDLSPGEGRFTKLTPREVTGPRIRDTPGL